MLGSWGRFLLTKPPQLSLFWLATRLRQYLFDYEWTYAQKNEDYNNSIKKTPTPPLPFFIHSSLLLHPGFPFRAAPRLSLGDSDRYLKFGSRRERERRCRPRCRRAGPFLPPSCRGRAAPNYRPPATITLAGEGVVVAGTGGNPVISASRCPGCYCGGLREALQALPPGRRGRERERAGWGGARRGRTLPRPRRRPPFPCSQWRGGAGVPPLALGQ